MGFFKDLEANSYEILSFIDTYDGGDLDFLSSCCHPRCLQNMIDDLSILITSYWDDDNPLFCISLIDKPFTYELLLSCLFEDYIDYNKEIINRKNLLLSIKYSEYIDGFFKNICSLRKRDYIEWAIKKKIAMVDFEWILKKEIYYPNTSLIYFIGSENPLTIKIGFTTNLTKRIKSLQTGFPRKLIVYGIAFGDQQTERKLHKHFAKRKSLGEWFYLDEELKQFILNLSYPKHDFPYFYHYNLLHNIEKVKTKLKKHSIPY